MNTDSDKSPSAAELPESAVGRRRRFSLVWLIPIVAAIAGAWLVYTTFAERGPTITVVFQAASGFEPGKTPIKYRDVQLGLVQRVRLSDDLQHVVVTARMDKSAEKVLRAGTEFWIESARITAGGVSGFGTLLSGAYIGMRPGPGAPKREFVALETPPVYEVDVPGKHFVLRADKLGSVSAGAPIYFRGIQVGSVLGYQLDENGWTSAFTRSCMRPLMHSSARTAVLERQRHRRFVDSRRAQRPHRIVADDRHGRRRVRHTGRRKREQAGRG
jgi:paraquat-inducible protein B